ncbi:hypothetical protein DMC25_18645 [Caulobacter sp. D4A]|nr:hypothetical protein DMC25_18645 [Caulobacter sp. D4A]
MRSEALHSGHTPLCPAGHLPLKGGDRIAAGPHPQFGSEFAAPVTLNAWRSRHGWPISPLEGEMSGRTEGGDPTPKPKRAGA